MSYNYCVFGFLNTKYAFMRDAMISTSIVIQLTIAPIRPIGYMHLSIIIGISGYIGNEHSNLCHLQSLSEYDNIMFNSTIKGDVYKAWSRNVATLSLQNI